MSQLGLSFFALLLVACMSGGQLAAGQSANCCADMPQIVADLQASIDELKTLTASHQKAISNLQTKGKSCEDDPDRCYVFTLTRKPWQQSKEDCEKKGGHLLFINSQKEQDLIIKFIETANKANTTKMDACKNGGIGQTFSLGARRPGNNCAKDMMWMGPGDKQTSLTYTNWGQGQPSCTGTADVQMCSLINVSWQYKWDDIECGPGVDQGNSCAICEFDQ